MALITIKKSNGSTIRWDVSDAVADQVLKLIAGGVAEPPRRKYSRANEDSWGRRGPKRKIPFTKEQLEQALELREQGEKIGVIARMIGASPRTLERDLARYDSDPEKALAVMAATQPQE